MSEISVDQRLFERAQSVLKTHGILSIIFGALGVLGFIIWTLFASLSFLSGEFSDVLGMIAITMIFFVVFLLPHIYLIVSGIQLTRSPSPKLARVIVIINLILGLFWNLVLLVLAIINLTQIGDYERYYGKHKK